MPELPEVETTCSGIAPHVSGQRIRKVIIREHRLRWPVPRHLAGTLAGQTIDRLERRAKYLLFHTKRGCLILHLGMSGSLRITRADEAPGPHDRIDIQLENSNCLRFRDPRKFGSLHWTTGDPLAHPLLKDLGPEPFARNLAEHLYRTSRRRRVAIKQLLMDSHVVAGIGNIYASEILFRAGIHPARAAGRISRERYQALARAVREVLRAAIRKGGTTLRDFVSGEGRPGYFRLSLKVYDRAGAACPRCGHAVRQISQGQRSTFYCPGCQR